MRDLASARENEAVPDSPRCNLNKVLYLVRRLPRCRASVTFLEQAQTEASIPKEAVFSTNHAGKKEEQKINTGDSKSANSRSCYGIDTSHTTDVRDFFGNTSRIQADRLVVSVKTDLSHICFCWDSNLV
ncbi:Hypp8428 [Branchiostoma lanceolatum]|uniref:Hypp8428 protein n=1 Tax=Branchiostoma lanceolatum TaxID=7740 RepID=A0A8J9Z8L0_BRALA|nr:Hypp8428 [Branchiostoma lanceolatum]